MSKELELVKGLATTANNSLSGSSAGALRTEYKAGDTALSSSAHTQREAIKGLATTANNSLSGSSAGALRTEYVAGDSALSASAEVRRNQLHALQLLSSSVGATINDNAVKLSGIEAGNVSAAEERFSLDDYTSGAGFDTIVSDLAEEISSAAESGSIESTVDSIIKETKMSKEDLIRQFIRETIYHSTQGLAAPQPTGYAYRAPHETDPEKDAYESDPESVVNYKTDMGGVAYSARPEDLREEALRRIIRRKLEEQKKKTS